MGSSIEDWSKGLPITGSPVRIILSLATTLLKVVCTTIQISYGDDDHPQVLETPSENENLETAELLDLDCVLLSRNAMKDD